MTRRVLLALTLILLPLLPCCNRASTRVATGGVRPAASARASEAPAAEARQWVGTWATGVQITEERNLPPAPGLAEHTLRQIVRVSIGGNELRLRISNEYGTTPVALKSVHVARSLGGSEVETGSDVALTFSEKEDVTIAPGTFVTSDPFNFALQPLSRVAISIAFGEQTAEVTGHPSSRTTSYLQAGNHAASPSLSGATTDHWYFISGIDVMADPSTRAIVMLGDSITDGRGSTTNGNDRWPDRLAERLQAEASKQNIAVLNLAIGGNAVVRGGLGPTALARFKTQILDQPGVHWVMVLEGVNDIGAGTSASDLIAGLKTIVDQAHAAGLRVYGIPVLPFHENEMYDSPEHQQTRTAVNDWIRSSGSFDAVIPMDEAVSDGHQPPGLAPAYDDGDRLHLNPAGYKKMADTVDLSLFE